MKIRVLADIGVASLLGAVAGNLAYYLLRSYRQRQQVRVGALPDSEVIRAVWVPQSTIAATFLASRVTRRRAAMGFFLSLAFTLAAAPAFE